MWSGALQSPGVLLSHPIVSLAQHRTTQHTNKFTLLKLTLIAGYFNEQQVADMLAESSQTCELPLNSLEARSLAHAIVVVGGGTDMGVVSSVMARIREGQWVH